MTQTNGQKAVNVEIDDNFLSSKSILISKNIMIHGRRTSVRLEPEMWQALHDISQYQKCKIHDICSFINDHRKPETSLTAAIRVFLMCYFWQLFAGHDGMSARLNGNSSFHETRHFLKFFPSQVPQNQRISMTRSTDAQNSNKPPRRPDMFIMQDGFLHHNKGHAQEMTDNASRN